MDAKKKPATPSSSSSSDKNMNQYLDESDSSDAGLPPPLPVTAPKGLPSLKMAGLGLSTLKAPGQDKTAEEMADLAALHEAKNQKKDSSSSDSDEYYREMERLKQYEGGSSSKSFYEGGSGSDEDKP